MSSRWLVVRKSPALVMIALLLGIVPLASAQYAIPDCFVATVNGMFPDEGYAAARDEMYREMNGEWSSNIAGMSAAQVTAYIPAFCGSLVVNDLGETDGTQHLEYGYLTGEMWLAENGGSTSSSTSSGNSGTTGNTSSLGGTSTINSNSNTTGGATVITSGSSGGNAAGALLGGSASGSTANTTNNTANSSTTQVGSTVVLFETEFDTMPRELEILDSDSGLIDGSVTTSDGDSFLTMKATTIQSLKVTSGAEFTDYTFEARIRVMAGSFAMTARLGESFCTGYDFGTDPISGFIVLSWTNEDCDPTELASMDDAAIGLDDWFTYRLEVNGAQITAFVDGEQVLSATDTNYAQGYPVIFIFPNEDDEALIDIDYIRVTEPGSTSPNVGASTLPQTLSAFDAPHSQVIAELVSLGLVPDGGTFIFKEPLAYAEGDGLTFTSLARSTPHTNVVMGGELIPTFAADGEYEDCTLMARVNMDDDLAEAELNVGVDSDGDATMFDLISLEEEGTTQFTPLTTPLTEPQHIIMIVMGDELTVYINGDLIFERLPVAERSGIYGIGLSSESENSRCEGRDIWVYSFD